MRREKTGPARMAGGFDTNTTDPKNLECSLLSSTGNDSRSSSPVPLALGEHKVTYEGETVCVDWCMDLRRRASQIRCGMSRKFTVYVGGRDVTFALHIDPIRSDMDACPEHESGRRKSKISFRSPNTCAHVWLQCIEPSALPSSGYPLQIVIASSGEVRQLAEAHDFAQEDRCKGQPENNTWLMPSFESTKNAGWHVSLRLQPAPSHVV